MRFEVFSLVIASLGVIGTMIYVALSTDLSGERLIQAASPRRLAGAMVFAYALFWIVYGCCSCASVRTKIARFALSTAAFALPWLFAESLVFFRIIDFRSVFEGAAHPVGYASLNPRWWRLDGELIHMRYPHMHIEGRTVGDIANAFAIPVQRYYDVNVQYDANGFRNQPSLQRAPIVVIGDSFVEAGLLPTEDILTHRMSKELGVAVANLGITMYGPQQELAVLRRYGLPLEPQVVCWMFFEGNDLLDAAQYMTQRRAVLNTYDSFLHRSLTRNAILKLFGVVTAATRTKTNLNSACHVTIGNERQKLYFRYGGIPLSDRDRKGLVIAKRTIEQASEICRKAGTEFILVFIPTKFRVYEDIGVFPSSGQSGSWKSNDLPEQLSDWCSQEQVDFLDLTEVMKSNAAEQLLYFDDDSHWSPAGHEVAGRAIAKWIFQRGSGTH